MNTKGVKDRSEEDTMRDEYDFTKMRVYRLGPGYKKLHVTIDDDVREMFPDSAAVNEALHFLIRVAQHNADKNETINQRPRTRKQARVDSR
ncbi:MAG: hypothetical protein NVSMB56_14260 [Pyrinomonadaceae bacterium]